jgi:hypothetical protein
MGRPCSPLVAMTKDAVDRSRQMPRTFLGYEGLGRRKIETRIRTEMDRKKKMEYRW